MRNYSKTYYKKWPIIDFLRLSISCWDLRGPKVLKFWGSRTESVGKTCQPVPGFFSARIDFLTGKLGRADVRFCVYLRSSLGRHWSEPKARSEIIFRGLVCHHEKISQTPRQYSSSTLYLWIIFKKYIRLLTRMKMDRKLRCTARCF